ncbi:hypothetical protein AMR74_15115 [Halorubrum tropicale]|uniref:Uncharacterized protein n=1 Tax=Halorubrum tropicale TaxID=1765655 RepID=A0A0M9AQ78_9EURY|nr:hypothetical protein AMR74_15115 [Halorubrum tropicale]
MLKLIFAEFLFLLVIQTVSTDNLIIVVLDRIFCANSWLKNSLPLIRGLEMRRIDMIFELSALFMIVEKGTCELSDETLI